MKSRHKLIYSIVIVAVSFGCAVLAGCGLEKGEKEKNEKPDSANTSATGMELPQNPVMGGADPFVLLHDGVYYLYATNAANGYIVYTSEDLKKWNPRGYCLTREDVEGNYRFWAPEVMYHNGRFYMVYSADEHLGIAVADSPLGPFRQEEKRFLSDKKEIDGHFFVDNDGSVYLYFSRYRSEGGNLIYGAKMNEDMLSYDESTAKLLIPLSEEWETRWGATTEGPYMLKHNGVYYLTYSANGYDGHDYAVGYATADTPLGDFKKYEGNPILSKKGELVGTGHHCFTTSLDGTQMYIVYHRHNSVDAVEPRWICIDKAYFEPAGQGKNDILVVDGPN